MTFLGGAIIMMMLVILSGMSDVAPLDRIYFLKAETRGITGARSITQWTFLRICGDDNENCGPARAAPPFGYAWDSNPRNAPDDLVGSRGGGTTSDFFFLAWRFGWVFYLIGLFFTACAFVSGFFSCIGRLGAKIAGLTSIVALLFYTIAVSLMTAEFVKARDVFHEDDRDAEIGKYAFGLSWGAFGAIFVAIVLFCIGGRADKSGDYSSPRRERAWLSALPFRRGGARSGTPAQQDKNASH